MQIFLNGCHSSPSPRIPQTFCATDYNWISIKTSAIQRLKSVLGYREKAAIKMVDSFDQISMLSKFFQLKGTQKKRVLPDNI